MKYLDLSERKTSTKQVNEQFAIYNLDEIKEIFDSSILKISNQLNNVKTEKDEIKKDSLLRYCVVCVESVFDYILHLLVKNGFVNMYNGLWNRTTRFNNFQITLGSVIESERTCIDEEWLIKNLHNKISNQTFLAPKDLKDCLNYIEEGLLETIAVEIYNTDKATSLEKLKNELNSLYKRRNEIAHQFDYEHKTGNKISIDYDTVEHSIEIINKVGSTLFEYLKNKEA